jgi:hypothetical protein
MTCSAGRACIAAAQARRLHGAGSPAAGTVHVRWTAVRMILVSASDTVIGADP